MGKASGQIFQLHVPGHQFDAAAVGIGIEIDRIAFLEVQDVADGGGNGDLSLGGHPRLMMAHDILLTFSIF